MIHSSRIDDVAAITFSNPPVNVLSIAKGVVPALGAAIRQNLADPQVAVLVIQGAGKHFSAGADLADLEHRDDTLERLRELIDVVERAGKPVVMAMHGLALGGGLEFAMGGHYRICTPEAQFGLPEVKLGLLPGGGGTQRLPRLVGAAFARDMMLGGQSIAADTALAMGLVDRIAAGDLQEEAVRFAMKCKAWGPKPTCALETVMGEGGKARVPAPGRGAHSQAPAFINLCIDAAMDKSFVDGMELEGRLFEELRRSEASCGLRHVFFGQREVAHIPGEEGRQNKHSISSVGVVGAGLMGTGIATALINAGLKVELVEPDASVIEKSLAAVRSALQRDVAKGRISQEKANERLDLLSPGREMAGLGEVDLVIEAVFEDMAVKREVFTELDRRTKPAAILASNTSTLDLDAIAAFTGRPDRVVGLHFFSPANIMKLLEIVRGAHTSGATVAAAMQFARAIGKIGVVSGVCDGFIGNRMFEEYLRQAYFLLEEGALPQQVDAALEAFGMAMGPFKVMDLAGQDIGWSIRKRRAVEQPERPYSRIPDLVCEMGRYGQKTGAGFYTYPDGRTAQIDPVIDNLVMDYSSRLGSRRSRIEDAEIVERCIYALVNEGAKILGEGIAYRAVDIDMVYIFGYGFAETRGGPMFHADRVGLGRVLDRIRHFAAGENGWAWEPAPLLVRLARDGGSFASVNRS